MTINKRRLLNASLAVIAVMCACWILRFKIIKLYYKSQWNSSSPEAMIKKHEKAFLEDRAILSKYDIFKPSKGTSDAGPYLNNKIHWQISETHHQGSLVLPLWLHKEMNKDWTKKKPLFKKMGLKFDWMKELHKYDYWNPEENSPAFPKDKKYFTYSFPIPTYKDLETWAKLRLLWGKEKGDMQSAFKDVRHLTRLIWTNDYLVSNMMTVRFLRLEHEVHEGNWEIIPEDALMRAKRHFYALPNAVDPHLSDAMWKTLTNTDLGICSMVNEGLMSYVAMRDMMKDELTHEYARMDKLVKESQTKCRATIVHKMYYDPTWPTMVNDDGNGLSNMTMSKVTEGMTWEQIRNDPDLKVVIGYLLMNVGMPMYFNGYDK